MRLVRGQRRAHQPPAEHSRRDGSPSVRRHRANFRDHEAARHRCLAQVSRNECPNRTPRRRRSIHAFASFADLRVFGAGGTSTSEHPTLWVLFRHSASEPGDVGRGPARVLQSSHARRPSGRLDASAEMTLNYGTGASEKKITPRLHMVNPPGHPRHALLGGSGRVAKKTIISARAQSRACATLNLGGLQGGGMCARPVDRVIVFFARTGGESPTMCAARMGGQEPSGQGNGHSRRSVALSGHGMRGVCKGVSCVHAALIGGWDDARLRYQGNRPPCAQCVWAGRGRAGKGMATRGGHVRSQDTSGGHAHGTLQRCAMRGPTGSRLTLSSSAHNAAGNVAAPAAGRARLDVCASSCWEDAR